MKTYISLAILCTLFGCADDPSAPVSSKNNTIDPNNGGSMEEDASVPEPALPMEMEMMDAGMPEPPKPPKPPKRPKPDAGMTDAQVPMDAAVDAAVDAGPAGDAAQPNIDAGPPVEGLRNLTMHMTGMGDDLRRFAQFRVANEADEFHIMFVIHEGLTGADYTWTLPNALLPDESYRLDFWVDHDDTTGPGFFDEPPLDHAWTLAIPAGEGHVTIEFPHNDNFVDIEDTAPTPFRSLLLTSTDLSEYTGELYDVRVIERSTGRLVGRQIREIPGDSFDLTVGSTLRPGVEYQIDVAVDADGDGDYDFPGDPSWRIFGTGINDYLRLTLNATSPQVDVGF